MLTGNELREINDTTPSTSTSRETYPETHSSTSDWHKDISNTFKSDKTKKDRNGLKPKRLFGNCKHSSASDKISNLTPSSNEQQTSITCVVKRKGPLREWSGGMVFDMDLEDETGKIKATAWNKKAEELYALLDVGTQYLVKHPWISPIKDNERKFDKTGHNFRITLGKSTEILIAEEDISDFEESNEDDSDQQERPIAWNRETASTLDRLKTLSASEGSPIIDETDRYDNVACTRLINTQPDQRSEESCCVDTDVDRVADDQIAGEDSMVDNKFASVSKKCSKNLNSVDNSEVDSSQELIKKSIKRGSKTIISDDEGSSKSEDENSSDTSNSVSSDSAQTYDTNSDSEDEAFIDDSYSDGERNSHGYRNLLNDEIKYLSRQTNEDIENRLRYEDACLQPQLGTTDKIRKYPNQISDRLHLALQERASRKWLPLSRLIREFKFLYSTEDHSKMSECICGAPGALRLKSVHWYVNASLYKTDSEQEKNKFKVGGNCAYWLQLDHAVYSRKENLDLPHFKFNVYHFQGLTCTFYEDDSDIENGIFAFEVLSNNKENILQTYDEFKDTYDMANCIQIECDDKLLIYVHKSDFCTYPGDDEGIVADGAKVNLKFRTVIVKKRTVIFELIECKEF